MILLDIQQSPWVSAPIRFPPLGLQQPLWFSLTTLDLQRPLGSQQSLCVSSDPLGPQLSLRFPETTLCLQRPDLVPVDALDSQQPPWVVMGSWVFSLRFPFTFLRLQQPPWVFSIPTQNSLFWTSARALLAGDFTFSGFWQANLEVKSF